MRLHYGKKQREHTVHFYFCRLAPRPLKFTHDFWCGCPQPGILKIGKFPFEKNYSNAPKSRRALKSLISSGTWRFFILIFTGRKEHKIGSEMRQKRKKSKRKKFCWIERTLENTGFSRVHLERHSNFGIELPPVEATWHICYRTMIYEQSRSVCAMRLLFFASEMSKPELRHFTTLLWFCVINRENIKWLVEDYEKNGMR